MFWVWEVMEREGLQGQEGAGRGREALAQTPAAWVYLTLAIALSLKGTLARSPSYVLGGFCFRSPETAVHAVAQASPELSSPPALALRVLQLQV